MDAKGLIVHRKLREKAEGDSMVVWCPIIQDIHRFPRLHVLLRCALSLSMSSVECEHLSYLCQPLELVNEVLSIWGRQLWGTLGREMVQLLHLWMNR